MKNKPIKKGFLLLWKRRLLWRSVFELFLWSHTGLRKHWKYSSTGDKRLSNDINDMVLERKNVKDPPPTINYNRVLMLTLFRLISRTQFCPCISFLGVIKRKLVLLFWSRNKSNSLQITRKPGTLNYF